MAFEWQQKSKRKSWKTIRKEVGELKTVKELVEYIPQPGLDRVSALLLVFLCSLPFWAGFTYEIGTSGFFIPGLVTSSWFYIIFSVGMLGVLVLLFWAARAFYTTSFQKMSKQRFLEQGLLFGLGGMFFFAVLSTLTSTNPTISFFGTEIRRDGLMAFFMYSGIFALAIAIQEKKMITLVLETLVGFGTLIGIVQIINLESLYEFFKIQLMQGTFFNSNHYGYYVCICLLSAATLMMGEDRIHPKEALPGAKGRTIFVLKNIVHYVEFAILANSMVLCQSLGPLLGVIGGLLLYTIFIWSLHKECRKKILILDGLFLLITFFVNTGYWSFTGEYARLLEDLSKLANGDGDGTGSGRGKLWKNAVIFIRQRPLLGFGLDNLGEVYEKAGCDNDRAHNEVLQFAATIGIPGVLCYLGGLACHLRNFFVKLKKLSVLEVGLYATVGGYLISSLFGNTIFYTTPYFLIILGFSYSRIKQSA